jgi:hypothetical protein
MNGITKENVECFEGLLDDFAAWNRSLSDAEIACLYKLAELPGLQLDATELDRLFGLYRREDGTVKVGGRTWQFKKELDGDAGQVFEKDGLISVIIDSEGNGLAGWK